MEHFDCGLFGCSWKKKSFTDTNIDVIGMYKTASPVPV